LLARLYDDVTAQKSKPHAWSLRGIPDVGVYKDLHGFLKEWPHTSSAPKVMDGKLYIAIAKN